MLQSARRRGKWMLDRYVRWQCRREYQQQTFRRHNERPVEFGYVFRKITQLYPRDILDVGTGTTALPHLMRNCGCLVTAIDNVRDYWPEGMVNRHYHVIDDDITATKIREQFDMVTCISVLEHIRDHASAVSNMLSLLKPGGHLVLTCPYTDDRYISNVYELPGSSYGQDAPYTTQSYSRQDLDGWLAASSADLIEQEYWQFWEGDAWTIGKQLLPPKQVDRNGKHQLSCMLIRAK